MRMGMKGDGGGDRDRREVEEVGTSGSHDMIHTRFTTVVSVCSSTVVVQ